MAINKEYYWWDQMEDCIDVQLEFINDLAKNNFYFPLTDIKYEPHPINEKEVRKYIINPLLRCLGWDFRSAFLDLDEDQNLVTGSHEERKLKYGRVDYAYLHEGNFKVFIETKRCGEPLAKHLDQIKRYILSVPSIEFVILTNANEWRFFMPSYEEPFYNEFLVFNINESNNKEVASDLIRMLSKNNIISGKSYQIALNYADRRSHDLYLEDFQEKSVRMMMNHQYLPNYLID